MYNKSAIMRSAWETYRTVRYECERRELAKGFIPIRFQNALRGAWADAKRAAVARPRTADEIYARITEIECSADFLSASDRAEVEALRSELRALPEPRAFEPEVPAAAAIRERIGAHIRRLREGTTAGLNRDRWKELGALRDRFCDEFSASV